MGPERNHIGVVVGAGPDIRAVTLACRGGNRTQGKFLSTLFCIAPSNRGHTKEGERVLGSGGATEYIFRIQGKGKKLSGYKIHSVK